MTTQKPNTESEDEPRRDGHVAYLALGSNLGDRIRHLTDAVEMLDAVPGIDIAAVSSIYETEAHRTATSPAMADFLNAVVESRTELLPRTLLSVCLGIERKMGRLRQADTWASRTIDIDILTFDEESIDEDRLTIPHPRLGQRRFVLEPLFEIAPKFVVPQPFRATTGSLLEECPDRHRIRRYGPPSLITPARLAAK